jgi:hypothetical protein
VQQAWDRHDRISAMAALTVSPGRRRLGYYFSLWTHNIATAEVVWFLSAMHGHFRCKVIVVLDRWQVHRAAARYFERQHPDWFQFEWLPAYAPELNPVEPSWSHTKYAELANFIPDDQAQLQSYVEKSLQRKNGNQALLRSFMQHTKLLL